MSTEELLFPRYKVIADYPGCPYEIDTVLYVEQDGELYSPIAGYSPSIVKVMQHEVDKFPHLFKKLEWMDERPIEDMPIYVKHSGNVYQVDRWSGSFQKKCWVGCYLKGDGVNFIYSHELTPATLAEYEQYINQKEKQ